MISSTAKVEPVSPSWALESILLPSLEEGIESAKIARSRRWSSPEEQARALQVMFGFGMEFLRCGIEPTLERLAVAMHQSSASHAFRTLGAVKDWNWLIDRIRLRDSGRGRPNLADSALLIRSEPQLRRGASVFGVYSRSIPAAVMKALDEHDLAPAYNPPQNSMATDCSALLVEVAEDWRFALRVEPLAERTWFDLDCYDEAQRPYAAEALRRIHGEYQACDMAVVRDSLIDSFLSSVQEIAGDASGLTYESGCLQQGEMGKRTAFVGGQLSNVMAIDRTGARPMLDLQRLGPHHPRARGGAPMDPWSGKVAIGGEDCSFLLEGENRPRSSHEMAWAAQTALLSKGPVELRGIFRPVDKTVIANAGYEPDDVRYVVARAGVGKHSAPASERVDVGFLVRDYRGEASGGWSITFGDLRNPGVQRAAIRQAEAHCKRMAPNGEYRQAISNLRNAGIQRNKARALPQIRARHGLILIADILNTRAALYV
jgi:hypothetical protein